MGDDDPPEGSAEGPPPPAEGGAEEPTAEAAAAPPAAADGGAPAATDGGAPAAADGGAPAAADGGPAPAAGKTGGRALAPAPPKGKPGGAANRGGARPAAQKAPAPAGDFAEIAMDDAFREACRLKGVRNPEEELRQKTIDEVRNPKGLPRRAALGDEEAQRQLEEELAQRRLEAEEDVRQRKLLIVLRERQRILRRQQAADGGELASPCAPSPGGARSQGTPSVWSLRRPRSPCGADQTDLAAQVERHNAFAERHLEKQLMARQAQKQHEDELEQRRDQLYRDLKMRHVMQALQQRVIERENERLRHDRTRAAEADMMHRIQIREEHNRQADMARLRLEQKQNCAQTALQHHASEQAAALHARVVRQRVRLLSASRSRAGADELRRRNLCDRIRGKDERSIRKVLSDRQHEEDMRQRREVREAYTRQVLGKGSYIAVQRQDALEDAARERQDRAAALIASQRELERQRLRANNLEQERYQEKAREEKQKQEQERQSCISENAQRKADQMAAVAKERRRREILLCEERRLAAEKRRQLVARQVAEQEEGQRRHLERIVERHRRSQEKLCLRETRQQEARDRALYTSELIRRHCQTGSGGGALLPRPPAKQRSSANPTPAAGSPGADAAEGGDAASPTDGGDAGAPEETAPAETAPAETAEGGET